MSANTRSRSREKSSWSDTFAIAPVVVAPESGKKLQQFQYKLLVSGLILAAAGMP